MMIVNVITLVSCLPVYPSNVENEGIFQNNPNHNVNLWSDTPENCVAREKKKNQLSICLILLLFQTKINEIEDKMFVFSMRFSIEEMRWKSSLTGLPEHKPLAIFTISFSAYHFPCFSDDSRIVRRQCFWLDFGLTAAHNLGILMIIFFCLQVHTCRWMGVKKKKRRRRQ